MSIKKMIAGCIERRRQEAGSNAVSRRASRESRRERRLRSTANGAERTARRQQTRARLQRVADVIRQEFRSPRTFRQEVEAALIPMLPDSKATAADIANQLGVSRQTLYRKLQEEETSFKEVLAAKRQQLAIHYLGVEQRSVKAVAWRLGFSSPEAFSRAFKRWTGVSPGKFHSLNAPAS